MPSFRQCCGILVSRSWVSNGFPKEYVPVVLEIIHLHGCLMRNFSPREGVFYMRIGQELNEI
jgi:hypothetical protein